MRKLVVFGSADMIVAAFGACDEYADAVKNAFGVSLFDERTSDGDDALAIEGETESVEGGAPVCPHVTPLIRRRSSV